MNTFPLFFDYVHKIIVKNKHRLSIICSYYGRNKKNEEAAFVVFHYDKLYKIVNKYIRACISQGEHH